MSRETGPSPEQERVQPLTPEEEIELKRVYVASKQLKRIRQAGNNELNMAITTVLGILAERQSELAPRRDPNREDLGGHFDIE